MAEAQVLVIDDDTSLRRVLGLAFDGRGYAMTLATTGASGLQLAEQDEFDLVILDLGLPDIDGIEVCRHLRSRTTSPIIVLSADGAEERKVMALDEGADDYLTKPFSMPELLARVRVALRHRKVMRAIVERDAVVVGGLTMDPAALQAVVDGQVIELTRKQFALLLVLARNVGKVLTHRALLDQVWGPDQPLDTLRTHVSHVRRKLGTGPDVPRIVTAPGVGYRMLDADDALA